MAAADRTGPARTDGSCRCYRRSALSGRQRALTVSPAVRGAAARYYRATFVGGAPHLAAVSRPDASAVTQLTFAVRGERRKEEHVDTDVRGDVIQTDCVMFSFICNIFYKYMASALNQCACWAAFVCVAPMCIPCTPLWRGWGTTRWLCQLLLE